MNKYLWLFLGTVIFTSSLLLIRQYLKTKQFYLIALAFLLFVADFFIVFKINTFDDATILYIIRSTMILLAFFVCSVLIYDKTTSIAQIAGVFFAILSIIFLSLK